MNDEAIPVMDLINQTFNNISVCDVKNASNMFSVWNKVLNRIKGKINPNEGKNMASHSRIIDLKNGVLLVEADHPGWIELLQLHKNYILTGLKMEIKDIEINSMAIKLKGKKGEIFDFERKEDDFKKAQEKSMERLNRQEESLKRMGYAENTKNSKEMPEELKNLFDKLKSDMLTNIKNK
ncbi:DciA family protein [Treponema sp.]|uniref:DciA family protein n=1 Tax=Treponema sp. TaxID=166 RepID=UPI0025E4A648|nr:DciA family protein [Treponema sp.]MCR5217670.1 DUF721 domain-containing protein [Treponema sp.]